MPSSSDKIVDEFPCVKGAQVIDALAKAHELHRHLQLQGEILYGLEDL